jgi:uncharacterized protein
MKKIFSQLLIIPIRLYQIILSPYLGQNCRHVPTCSQYALEAIEVWGPVKGLKMALNRIRKCHPWGESGYDPVPKKEK